MCVPGCKWLWPTYLHVDSRSWGVGVNSGTVASLFHFTFSSAQMVSRPSSDWKHVEIFLTWGNTLSLLALPVGTTSRSFMRADVPGSDAHQRGSASPPAPRRCPGGCQRSCHRLVGRSTADSPRTLLAVHPCCRQGRRCQAIGRPCGELKQHNNSVITLVRIVD